MTFSAGLETLCKDRRSGFWFFIDDVPGRQSDVDGNAYRIP
jgi:P pilus assembly chaperone PapD